MTHRSRIAPGFRERPILFSAPMVRAILEGRKTQTRRVVKNPDLYQRILECAPCCPYGKPGERLWVREAWYCDIPLDEPLAERLENLYFRADGEARQQFEQLDPPNARIWKPSIFMPRWASRITLEVTCVGVERLHDITGADLLKEGIAHGMGGFGAYEKYWDSLHVKGDGVLFTSNPWVWVIEFRRVEQTSDEKQPAVSI